MGTAATCAAGKELEMIGGPLGPFSQRITREHTTKAGTEHRRKITRLAALALGVAVGWPAAAVAAATLTCSLPAPTDTLPTTQRPSIRSQAATSILSNLVPLDFN